MIEHVRKFLLVAILTVFIWSWAYQAQEEQLQESGTLHIAPRTSQNLLVTFGSNGTSIPLDITFQGPAVKVADLQRRLHGVGVEAGHETLEFFYNVETANQAKPGTYTINVLGFLKESNKIKGLGLSVVSVKPENAEIHVEELAEKWLSIQVMDQNGDPIQHESVEPAKVKMFVPDAWTGDLLTAGVELTPQQIERARTSPVKVKPFVKLSPLLEKRRFADISVEVRLPSLNDALEDRVIQPRIGFLISRNLQGKYRIELLNENELTSATNFKATDEAFDEYDKGTRYQVLVDVRDGDENVPGEITREVIYNFPQEYVRRGEIRLSQPPRKATFKMTPIQAPAPAP